MRLRGFAVALACAFAFLTTAAQGGNEATPPNRGDPCARSARNTCGTAGVGYYHVGPYGQRWYGDFKGTIAGVAHAYCIDLRFWYPSAAYRYREDTGADLLNKDGEPVTALHRQLIAYAIARYGQTSSPDQAAAVMLYVHSLMGDARPGELDPADVNGNVSALFARVQRESDAYHGPYRIDFRVTGSLTVGKAATANVRVLSAAGNPVPGVALAIQGDGVKTRSTRTASTGGAVVSFTPANGSPRLTIRATGLPSTLPRVYSPTTAAAASNGQRLVVAGTQQITAALRSAASKRQLGVTTTASPSTVAVGDATTDKVTITGATPDWKATVTARLYGPFATLAQARCDGAPAWQGTFATNGPGTYTTPPVAVARAGWYTYVEIVPSDATHVGATTACGVAAESFKAQAVPKLGTTVSSQRVTVGSSITDRIHVSGLAGASVTIEASLFGPFAAKGDVRCDGTAAWTGTVAASADGDYETQDFTPSLPGHYTYRERIPAGDLVRAVDSLCGDVAETALVVAHPQVDTHVSDQAATVGASIGDSLDVTGLGSLSASLRVELWGPFTTAGSIQCTGAPLQVQTISISGDGSYSTSPIVLTAAGIYTFRASIAAGPLNDPFKASCGDAAETVVVKRPPPPPTTTTSTTTTTPPPTTPSRPTKSTKVFVPKAQSLTTVASHEVVKPGSTIHDRVKTQGVRGVVVVELFGPFPTRAAIRCTGAPAATRRITVRRDGEVPSPRVRLSRPGFYGFRERVLGPGGRARLVTRCGIKVETSLVAPQIVTGRGDNPRYVPAAGAGSLTPTRVRIRSLRIDASISAVGIDTVGGVLGVPLQIHRTGWWNDGARPTDLNGSVLIAGHVDNAKLGPGAFYKLGHARPGDHVQVVTRAGGTIDYRVVSVRRYLKTALPTRVWSRRGAARLVLVTCGGPFIRATAHYRDNVVVTAVPL